MTDKKKDKQETQQKKPQVIKIENLRTEELKNSEPDKETAELKEKLLAVEDKYLRLFAEFDNYRKRTENEKSDFAKYAAANFIEAVLPVLDSFEHSQKVIAADASDEVKKGFALIHKQLEDILQKAGVQKMDAVGKPFDPRFYEAIMQKESDQPSQTVLEEVRTGYLMYDKVLRAAMVVVAK